MRIIKDSTPIHSTVAAACSAVLLAAAAMPVQAQDQLTEVIVTGTRVPKAVDKIPGAITVIGEDSA